MHSEYQATVREITRTSVRLSGHDLEGLSLLAILFLVELTLLFGSGVLILLVLRHQVIHVAFSLGELHLVHPFPCVPMQERLATEHSREVLCNRLNISWIAVELPAKATAIFRPF